MNKQSQIVSEYLNVWFFDYEPFDKVITVDIINKHIDSIIHYNNECYDMEYYPIIATPNIRNTLELDKIAEYLNDRMIECLFDMDN